MAGNEAYQLDAGPIDPSVLTQQHTHRSRDVWNGKDNIILTNRKCDGMFWNLVKVHPIHPQVLEVIRRCGFYGVYLSNRPVVDRSLITPLVERWRPETHTFHFMISEGRITFQYVEVLYGLPIKGDPVLGNELHRTKVDWQNICQRLLGFTPCPNDFTNNSLKVSALSRYICLQHELPDLATQDMVNERARCYMFWMITSLLMADTSGSLLRLMYLPMLEDIDAIGSYSWGSATLACLYHFLCKASQGKQIEIAGFLPLLQFILEPYSVDLIEILPNYCCVGRDMWRARVQIFCWDVVELHLHDRVMRKFGMIQVIPTSFTFDDTHFDHDRLGRVNTNWVLEHAQWLPFLNHLDQYVCNALFLHGSLQYDDPYLIWFRRITHLLIGNPNPSPKQQEGYVPNATAYEAMARHIHLMVDKAKSLGDRPSFEDLFTLWE